MEIPINQFKRAIASGRTPIGAWLESGAASTAEALGSRRVRLSSSSTWSTRRSTRRK